MDKVKIKRVKKNKKEITTSEKIMAGVGLGSTLLGMGGAVSSKNQATNFVRTQPGGEESAGSKVKKNLKKVFGQTFGVEEAKAFADGTETDYLDSSPGDVSPTASPDGQQASASASSAAPTLPAQPGEQSPYGSPPYVPNIPSQSAYVDDSAPAASASADAEPAIGISPDAEPVVVSPPVTTPPVTTPVTPPPVTSAGSQSSQPSQPAVSQSQSVSSVAASTSNPSQSTSASQSTPPAAVTQSRAVNSAATFTANPSQSATTVQAPAVPNVPPAPAQQNSIGAHITSGPGGTTGSATMTAQQILAQANNQVLQQQVSTSPTINTGISNSEPRYGDYASQQDAAAAAAAVAEAQARYDAAMAQSNYAAGLTNSGGNTTDSLTGKNPGDTVVAHGVTYTVNADGTVTGSNGQTGYLNSSGYLNPYKLDDTAANDHGITQTRGLPPGFDTSSLPPSGSEGETVGVGNDKGKGVPVVVWHNGAWTAPQSGDKFTDGAGIDYIFTNGTWTPDKPNNMAPQDPNKDGQTRAMGPNWVQIWDVKTKQWVDLKTDQTFTDNNGNVFTLKQTKDKEGHDIVVWVDKDGKQLADNAAYTWATDPYRLDPGGTKVYQDPHDYASWQTANAMAQLLGGTVVTPGLGGSVTESNPQYHILLPNGQLLNAGLVAYILSVTPPSQALSVLRNDTQNPSLVLPDSAYQYVGPAAPYMAPEVKPNQQANLPSGVKVGNTFDITDPVTHVVNTYRANSDGTVTWIQIDYGNGNVQTVNETGYLDNTGHIMPASQNYNDPNKTSLNKNVTVSNVQTLPPVIPSSDTASTLLSDSQVTSILNSGDKSKITDLLNSLLPKDFDSDTYMSSGSWQKIHDYVLAHPDVLPQYLSANTILAYMTGVGNLPGNDTDASRALGYVVKDGTLQKGTGSLTTINTDPNQQSTHGPGVSFDFSTQDAGNGKFTVTFMVNGQTYTSPAVSNYADPVFTNWMGQFNTSDPTSQKVFAAADYMFHHNNYYTTGLETYSTGHNIFVANDGSAFTTLPEWGNSKVVLDTASGRLFMMTSAGKIVDITNPSSVAKGDLPSGVSASDFVSQVNILKQMLTGKGNNNSSLDSVRLVNNIIGPLFFNYTRPGGTVTVTWTMPTGGLPKDIEKDKNGNPTATYNIDASKLATQAEADFIKMFFLPGATLVNADSTAFILATPGMTVNLNLPNGSHAWQISINGQNYFVGELFQAYVQGGTQGLVQSVSLNGGSTNIVTPPSQDQLLKAVGITLNGASDPSIKNPAIQAGGAPGSSIGYWPATQNALNPMQANVNDNGKSGQGYNVHDPYPGTIGTTFKSVEPGLGTHVSTSPASVSGGGTTGGVTTPGAKVGTTPGDATGTTTTVNLDQALTLGSALGKDPTGKTTTINSITAGSSFNQLSGSYTNVKAGDYIQLNGGGMYAFTSASVIINGQEYSVSAFGETDTTVQFRIPLTIPSTVANGSAISIRLVGRDNTSTVNGILATTLKLNNSTTAASTTDSATPVITSNATLPDAKVGTSYTQQLTQNNLGGVVTWSVTSGSLPAGLTISSQGKITGTPIAATTTPAAFTIKATSNLGTSATKQFSLSVAPSGQTLTAVITSPATLPAATFGVAYSQQLTQSNISGTVHWTVASGALPIGLHLSDQGLISGTATVVGSAPYSFKVQVTNGTTTATKDMSIAVTSPAVHAGAPTVSFVSVTQAKAGDTINFVILGTHLTGATANLPSGLTLGGIPKVTDTQISGTLSIAATTAPGLKVITLVTPNGSTSVSLLVTPASTSNNGVVISDVKAFDLNGQSSGSNIAAGFTIEMDGIGLSAYSGATLVFNGQTQIAATGFVASNNKIVLIVPSVPSSVPGGSLVQVRLNPAQSTGQPLLVNSLFHL